MTSHPGEDAPRILLGRIRSSLAGAPIREVRMFGTIAVMVDDAMAVAVHKDGSMLIRVDPAEDARLLDDPGASRAEMGAGRSMGPGWIRVEASALGTDAALDRWLGCATRFLSERGRSRA